MYIMHTEVDNQMETSHYEIDEQRTAELNQPELLVLAARGDPDHFYCILVPSKIHSGCPHCGNPFFRNQGNMHRDFLDVIPRGDDAALITVSVEFRKSKCTAADCGRIYYPSCSFASPYARTTRRLDDAIVRMALREGFTYTETAAMLNGRLSRQAVYRIYHRRIKELGADTSDQTLWFREILKGDTAY